MSVPAIFFAYDGFYGASGIHDDLDKKEHFSKILM
jgi:hypothetical protein